MVKGAEEKPFPYLRRGKLVRLIKMTGLFKVIDRGSEKDLYIADSREDSKIQGCSLRAAIMKISSMRYLNSDEPTFKAYHDKLRELCSFVN